MNKMIDEIEVTINGQTRKVAGGRSIDQLLADLELHPRMIVVEHNHEIIDRERYAGTEVQAGDNLELVHFVGGG